MEVRFEKGYVGFLLLGEILISPYIAPRSNILWMSKN